MVTNVTGIGTVTAVHVAHQNRIRRLEGDRPAWRRSWYHRPLRVKRLMAVAMAKKKLDSAA